MSYFLLTFASTLKQEIMRDNKKPLLIVLAVVIFFAGAILITELPKLATLFMFLAVAAATVVGFFIGKHTYLTKLALNMNLNAEAQKINMQLSEKIKSLVATNTNLDLENSKLRAEILDLKKPVVDNVTQISQEEVIKPVKKSKKKSK